MSYKRALWHSGLTYQQTCTHCRTVLRYTDYSLGFRAWYPDGFVYCPKCNGPLRHNELYAINEDGTPMYPQSSAQQIYNQPPDQQQMPQQPMNQQPMNQPPMNQPPMYQQPVNQPFAQEPAPQQPVILDPVGAPQPPVQQPEAVQTDAQIPVKYFCVNCGRSYTPGYDHFCSNCGTKLD